MIENVSGKRFHRRCHDRKPPSWQPHRQEFFADTLGPGILAANENRYVGTESQADGGQF